MKKEGNMAMKISTALRHLREGLKNVWRNGWMSFASTSAIAISLFVLGVFLLLTLNVNYLTDQLESQVEIQVYLDVGLNNEQVLQMQNQIGGIPNVSKVTFVPKEEGMKQLRERLGDIVDGYEGDQNPLPDKFIVEVDEPRNIDAVAVQINALNEGQAQEPIHKVQYGKDTVEKLFKITEMIRTVGLILVAGLAFTAMFLISNTIKLTIIARQREISIMKLVGATNSFIQWPFFIEGAVLGIVGSAIPAVVILYGYSMLIEMSKMEMGLMYIELLSVQSVSLKLLVLLLSIGVLIGIWGSTLSVRKFLKV